MAGVHKLFDAVAGKHGELHGGWRGPSPKDPLQHPAFEVSWDEAINNNLLVRKTLAPGVDFSKETPGWNPGMNTDDQGQLGSCVSFGAKHTRQRLSLKLGHQLQQHSPRWIYHMMQERFEPQSLGQDTGAYVSWAGAVMVAQGIGLEADWPYSDDPAQLVPNPTWAANFHATYYKNVVPVSVPATVATFKQALMADYPILFGMLVYPSFYNAQGNGNVPTPNPGREQPLGGHCNMLFGYQDDASYDGGGYFLSLNQWGTFSPNNFLRLTYAEITEVDPTNGAVVSDCWTYAIVPGA